MGSSIDDDEVFLETSVLVDFAQWGSRSQCFRLFKDHGSEKSTSPYVKEEYERKKRNREYVVEYFQRKAGREDDDFDDFAPPEDERLTESDLDYAEELLADLAEADDWMAAMEELDDRRRRFRRAHRVLFDEEIGLLSVFPADPDPSLLGMLKGPIGNRDDERVVAEAVDWADCEGAQTVLSLDERDIVNQEDGINEAISLARGVDCMLSIYHVEEFLKRTLPDS